MSVERVCFHYFNSCHSPFTIECSGSIYPSFFRSLMARRMVLSLTPRLSVRKTWFASIAFRCMLQCFFDFFYGASLHIDLISASLSSLATNISVTFSFDLILYIILSTLHSSLFKELSILQIANSGGTRRRCKTKLIAFYSYH